MKGFYDFIVENRISDIAYYCCCLSFSAHQCFERLIKCVESFLHPLHEGGHTPTLQIFLDALVKEMVRRVRIERVRRKTKSKVFLNKELEILGCKCFFNSNETALY